MEDRHKNAILNICRGWANRIEEWNIQDPYFLENQEAEVIYGEIKAKVEDLARRM